MNTDEIKNTVLTLLCRIAPEANPSELQLDANLRDQLDVDSMDLLNFMISLHKEFGIEIPERDYPQLGTINGCVSYVDAALSAESTGGPSESSQMATRSKS